MSQPTSPIPYRRLDAEEFDILAAQSRQAFRNAIHEFIRAQNRQGAHAGDAFLAVTCGVMAGCGDVFSMAKQLDPTIATPKIEDMLVAYFRTCAQQTPAATPAPPTPAAPTVPPDPNPTTH